MSAPQWWPLATVKITQEFGSNAAWYKANVGQAGHNGIDLACPVGTPVYAADDGTVVIEGWNTPWSGKAGGISAVLKHAFGHTGYAHLSRTVINAGQKVTKGQLIGYSGSTGLVSGPHLHFEAMPLNVNWGNGYAGRVNPRSLMSLAARGTKPAVKPASKGIQGSYRVNASALNVRDRPSTGGKVVATYKQGMTVNLDAAYTIADGFVWGTYMSDSGKRRYIALGPNTGKASASDYLIKK